MSSPPFCTLFFQWVELFLSVFTHVEIKQVQGACKGFTLFQFAAGKLKQD
jgi:hypothetical protein